MQTNSARGYVLGFHEIDRTDVEVVGGKGAHLAELSRIEGVRVPAGYCVSTDAFDRIMREGSVDDRLASAEIRRAFDAISIPDDLAAAITRPLDQLGEQGPYAVRSSATAEDLPTTSFAGQHDTYLNVVGKAAVLEHVRRCWASLFTEQAVTYRLRNGIDHREVRMAVVVQRMVEPHAAGVMFTADPVSGNRKATIVEAVFGLGDSLVSGRVNADLYEVRGGTVVARTIATEQRALTDVQLLELAHLGRRIEAHFGGPQDIEWCLDDQGFHIVQSRAITTLFPVPVADDEESHVYISVGHQQMMTDPMRPLGLSLFQLTARPRMYEAGSRLFVDVTGMLAAPASRAALLDAMGKHDLLLKDAIDTLLARGDFLEPLLDEAPPGPPAAAAAGAPASVAPDPGIVTELIAQSEASIAALSQAVQMLSGSALIDFILADIAELKRMMADPLSHRVFMTAIDATWWLNEQLLAWLGEKNAADALAQSVPHNVTSEMGLALLEVADVIRPHAKVVEFLRAVDGDGFLDQLARLPGGAEARDAIQSYLGRYGMRCVGEIDITRPRWSECPSTLLPMLLGNITSFEPGAAAQRFERGRQEARKKEHELLGRLRGLPDGDRKAKETKRMIDRLRAFIGYREYPKYAMISRYLVYKKALMKDVDLLVRAKVLRTKEDAFYLTMQELRDVVHTRQVDDRLIVQRRDAFRSHQALTTPRVLTSDGEVIAGAYRRDDLPTGALVGLPVSAGTVEGRARVILDVAKADLEPGDILVTAYTDPSWTPLFVAITGLVTEVGGVMTHGAVIAREYGLPAVVGVQDATRLIRDGQRIRVHGTEGYVAILPAAAVLVQR